MLISNSGGLSPLSRPRERQPRRMKSRTWLIPAFFLVTGLSLETTLVAQVAMAIGQNFTASTFGSDTAYTPPDCNGAPGLAHYVELINGRFSVYLKSNGTLVQTKSTAAFWTAAGITFPAGWEITDPRLIYDPNVARWFASSVDFDPTQTVNTNHFLIAVSAGANPTGSWRGVAFPSDRTGKYFADYPTLGLNAQGVFVAGDMFDSANNSIGSVLVSIPKSDLLAAPPVVQNRTEFGVLGNSFGSVLQPAVALTTNSSPGHILAAGDLGYDFASHRTLVGASINGITSAGAAIHSSPAAISVPAYSIPLNPMQPDGSTNLDDGDGRLSATVYEVNGVLYAVQGTQIGSHAAVQWYRVRAGDFALLESGTISDPNLDLFYPSVAANTSGTVVIACNGGSINQFVSIYACAGQTIGDTTTFGNLMLLNAGVASYQESGLSQVSRWGDYTTLTPDPVDPWRFWTIQMYPSSASTWSTQITELLTASPYLTITPSGTNALVCWPGTTGVYNLEATPDLSSPSWAPVGTATAAGGQVCTTLPTTSGTMFFRLQQAAF